MGTKHLAGALPGAALLALIVSLSAWGQTPMVPDPWKKDGAEKIEPRRADTVYVPIILIAGDRSGMPFSTYLSALAAQDSVALDSHYVVRYAWLSIPTATTHMQHGDAVELYYTAESDTQQANLIGSEISVNVPGRLIMNRDSVEGIYGLIVNSKPTTTNGNGYMEGRRFVGVYVDLADVTAGQVDSVRFDSTIGVWIPRLDGGKNDSGFAKFAVYAANNIYTNDSLFVMDRVGIGTVTPEGQLEIKTASPTIYMDATGGQQHAIHFEFDDNPVWRIETQADSDLVIGRRVGVSDMITFDEDAQFIQFFAGDTSYQFPSDRGDSGQVLKTNASGVLSWADDNVSSGGSGSVDSAGIVATTTLWSPSNPWLLRPRFGLKIVSADSAGVDTAAIHVDTTAIYSKGSVDTALAARSLTGHSHSGITGDLDPDQLAGDATDDDKVDSNLIPKVSYAAKADSAGKVMWLNIGSVPAGFADGVDDVGEPGATYNWLDSAKFYGYRRSANGDTVFLFTDNGDTCKFYDDGSGMVQDCGDGAVVMDSAAVLGNLYLIVGTDTATITNAFIDSIRAGQFGGGGGASALDDLADVDTAGYANNKPLVWVTNQWQPGNIDWSYISSVSIDSADIGAGVITGAHLKPAYHDTVGLGVTAYGWGNHADEGYIVGPADSSDIAVNAVTGWHLTTGLHDTVGHGQTAYGWGDHGAAGYEKYDDSASYQEVPKSVVNTKIVIGNVSDTATADSTVATQGYVKGQGYIKSYNKLKLPVYDAAGAVTDSVVKLTFNNGFLVADVLENGEVFISQDVDDSTLQVASDGDKNLRVKASGITSSHIADNTIDSNDIKDGAVRSSEILNGTIATADLATGARIDSAKYGYAVPTGRKLEADGAVYYNDTEKRLYYFDENGAEDGEYKVARTDELDDSVTLKNVYRHLDHSYFDTTGMLDSIKVILSDSTSGGAARAELADSLSDADEKTADKVGAMVTGNTETAISVTYQDADNTLDFAVDTTVVATRNYVNDQSLVVNNLDIYGDARVWGGLTLVNQQHQLDIGNPRAENADTFLKIPTYLYTTLYQEDSVKPTAVNSFTYWIALNGKAKKSWTSPGSGTTTGMVVDSLRKLINADTSISNHVWAFDRSTWMGLENRTRTLAYVIDSVSSNLTVENAAAFSSDTTDDYWHPDSSCAMHPSVLYIPNGWNGYRWLMAYTTIPVKDKRANFDFEIPAFAVSNDGETWHPFIDSFSTSPTYDSMIGPVVTRWNYLDCAALADPDIMVDADGVLWMYYIVGYWDASFIRQGAAYTTDGLTWNTISPDGDTLFVVDTTLGSGQGYRSISAVLGPDRTYDLFLLKSFDVARDSVRLMHYQSDYPCSLFTLVDTTGGISFTTGGDAEGRKPWHMDVIKRGTDEYILVANFTMHNSQSEAYGPIVAARSTNRGKTWTWEDDPALLTNGLGVTAAWDAMSLYRPTGYWLDDGQRSSLRMYYSALDTLMRWHTGVTTVRWDGDMWDTAAVVDTAQALIAAIDSTKIGADKLSLDDVNWRWEVVPFTTPLYRSVKPTDSVWARLPHYNFGTDSGIVLLHDSTNTGDDTDWVYAFCTVPFAADTADSIIFTYKVSNSAVIDSIIVSGPRASGTNVADSAYKKLDANLTATSWTRTGIAINLPSTNAGDNFAIKFWNNLGTDNGTVRVSWIQMRVKR